MSNCTIYHPEWKILYHFIVNFKWHLLFYKLIKTVSIVNRAHCNRPFYSCVLSCQAFDLEGGSRWPCCDRNQYPVNTITNYLQNKVNLSLTPVQRLGNQAHNSKMDYLPNEAFGLFSVGVPVGYGDGRNNLLHERRRHSHEFHCTI